MFKISKRSEYGLFFLLALAEKNGGPEIKSINQISQKLELPYRFLSQIAGDFKKANIVGSKEGIKGGYFLKKAVEDISLYELVSVLDDEPGIANCFHHKGCKRDGRCKIQKGLREINNQVVTLLKVHNVKEFTL